MGRISVTPLTQALMDAGLRLPAWHHRATHTRMDIFWRAVFAADQRIRFKIVLPPPPK